MRWIEDEIASLTGDKGYDQNSVYKAVLRDNKEADIIIHPIANAVVSEKRKWTQRDKLSKRSLTKGFTVGEENRGIINKVGLRTHFIGIRLY